MFCPNCGHKAREITADHSYSCVVCRILIAVRHTKHIVRLHLTKMGQKESKHDYEGRGHHHHAREAVCSAANDGGEVQDKPTGQAEPTPSGRCTR